MRTRLQRRGVSVSLRGSALRVAPHLYNDDTDMAALLAALRAARGVTSSAAAPRTPA
jgi:selenocysteine lyase/cysteine desulfurase